MTAYHPDVDTPAGKPRRQPAFCPSLPMASDNWKSGTTTRAAAPPGR
ncbi:hypothetical protein I552_5083 [Mycobacterium xenopi 3993]|nr:hypothetical protein I552_5083 [Mycobacterium xenopi 3993]